MFLSVVGTSTVVILSIGGSENITSIPLGAFFFGASLTSIFGSPWIFQYYGRKAGFLTGIAFGFVGTALGAGGIAIESPPLFIVSSAFFGMAMGIGFYLRFAAVEVVSPHWAARAVSASYIFEAGGSELDAWRTLNLVVVGLLVFLVVVFGVNAFLDKPRACTTETNDQACANEMTQHDSNT